MSTTCEINIPSYLTSLGFEPQQVWHNSQHFNAFNVRQYSYTDCMKAGTNMSWTFYQLFVKLVGVIGYAVSDSWVAWSERELEQLGENELKSFFQEHCCHDNPNLLCMDDGKRHVYLLNPKS
jgi:hypothetical protein